MRILALALLVATGPAAAVLPLSLETDEAVAGEDLDREVEELLASQVPGGSPFDGATTGEVNRLAGKVDDVNFPSTWEAPCEDGGNCHVYATEPRPFLDVRANYGVSPPTPVFVARTLVGVNALPNPNRDGPTAAPQWGAWPGQLHVTAWFGLWHDVNGDGFVTDHAGDDETPDEGCPDLRDCGADDDPNEFAPTHAEFTGVNTVLAVDVWPDTPERVWPGGVYVTGPRPGTSDELTPILLDPTDDADGNGNPVDRLVLRGAIRLPLGGDPAAPGSHRAERHIVLPRGSAEHDIVLDARTPNNGGAGVCHATGCTWDVDVLHRWLT